MDKYNDGFDDFYKENTDRLKADKINKGKEIIFKERQADWEELVNTSINKEDRNNLLICYTGEIVKSALAVMVAINEGKDKAEINEIIDNQNHSGYSYSSVLRIVTQFSKKGVEFYRDQKGYLDISEEMQEYLKKLIKENKQYAKNEKSRISEEELIQ